MTRLALAAVLLAACGDDGGGGGTQSDAAIDTMAARVASVTCPSSPAATVLTVDTTDAYMPVATTITVGQIVKFQMSSAHDVNPNPVGGNIADANLLVNEGQTKCFQFNQAGTYGFFCGPHSFAGTITVN